jgi:hypothetical protein
MDAVKEPVNWSAVACRAFEDKLAEISIKKEEKGIDDIIQRLRASKPDLIYQQGQEDGRRWASQQAEYEDLLRLEQLHARKRAAGDWEKFFHRDYGLPNWEQTKELFSKASQGKVAWSLEWDSEATVGERLVRAVCPRLNAGDLRFDCGSWRRVCQEFWQSFVGDDDFKVDHPSYVRGFAEGALAVWSQVKDRV